MLHAFLLLLFAYGGWVVAGGIRLAMMGGVWRYACFGAAMAVSAVLLALDRREGFWLFAAAVAATVIDALWAGGGWMRFYRLRGVFVFCLGMATLGHAVPQMTGLSRHSFYAVTLGLPLIMAAMVAATI